MEQSATCTSRSDAPPPRSARGSANAATPEPMIFTRREHSTDGPDASLSLADALEAKDLRRRAINAEKNSPTPAIHGTPAETELAAELKARRRVLIAKNIKQQLEMGDLIQHEVFIEQRAQETIALREQLAHQHRRAHARLQLARRTDKRGENVGKMAVAITQGENVEREVDKLNVNVRALHAEADWLHASAGWKQLLLHLQQTTIRTKTGQVFDTAQLEEDEELYGEGGELSFESLLQSMKEEAREASATCGDASGRGEGDGRSTGRAAVGTSSEGERQGEPGKSRAHRTRARKTSSQKVTLHGASLSVDKKASPRVALL